MFFTFCSFFILVAGSLGASVPVALPRIVNGVPIPIEDMPYVVQVDRAGFQICTGVILSENFVLTAAECVTSNNNNLYRVRAGSADRNKGGSLHHIIYSYSHPDYDIYYWEYDVAVMKVDPPIKFDSTRQPISIGATPPSVSSVGLIAGWGNTVSGGQSSEVLLAANVTVSEGICETVKDLQFCVDASESAACSGDWGSPFVQDGVVLGLGSLFQYCRTYNTFVSVVAETNHEFIIKTAELD